MRRDEPQPQTPEIKKNEKPQNIPRAEKEEKEPTKDSMKKGVGVSTAKGRAERTRTGRRERKREKEEQEEENPRRFGNW